MAVVKRDSLPPSICGPSSGDGSCADNVSTDSWTGASNPGVTGVKSSQPVGSGDQYDAATTSRLAGLESAHIAASQTACNYSAHLDGGLTGAGEPVGGTSGLVTKTGYGDAPADNSDTGRVVG
jgi:hypothetical protein